MDHLVAYAARNAGRAGSRPDSDGDRRLDAAFDRFRAQLVAALHGDPVIFELEREAERGSPPQRTREKVRSTIEDAARESPQFAAQLDRHLHQLQSFGPMTEPGPQFSVRADRGSTAAGRDAVTTATGPRARAAGRDIVTVRSAAVLATLLVLVAAVAVYVRYGPQFLYQRQALGTCQRSFDVLSEPHTDAFTASFPDRWAPTLDPGGFVRIKKAVLQQGLTSDLSQVRSEFSALDHRPVPAQLETQKAGADRAFGRWVTARQHIVQVVKTRVRDGMTLTQLQQLGVLTLDGINVTAAADVPLNNAMSDLAGSSCVMVPAHAKDQGN